MASKSISWDMTSLLDVCGNHPISTLDPSGTPDLAAGVLTITDVSDVCWIDASDLLGGGWKFIMTVRDNALLSEYNTFFTVGYKSTKHKKSSFAVVRNPSENFVRLFNVCNFELSDPIAQINVNDNAYHTISLSFSPSKPRKKLLVQVDGVSVCDCSGLFIDSIKISNKPWVLLGTTGYTQRRKIYSTLNNTFMDAGNLSITNLQMQYGRNNYQSRVFAGAYSLDASNAELLNTSFDTSLLANNYSMSCYIKRPAVNTQTVLLFFGDSAGVWRRLEIDSVGVLTWNYSQNVFFETVPFHEIQAPNAGSNKWFHIALTMSGTSGKLYINGVLKSTTTIDFSPTALSSNQFCVGGTVASGTVTNLCEEKIDNVAVWNSTLTDAEVAAIFAAGHVDLRSDFTNYASSANLVAFYSFENHLYDLTDNEWHLSGTNEGFSTDIYAPSVGLSNTKSYAVTVVDNKASVNTPALNPPYSVGMWMYLNSFASNIRPFDATLTGNFKIQFNSAGTTKFNTTVDHTYTPPTGQWVYYMITINSGSTSLKFYVDGTLEATLVPQFTQFIDDIRFGDRDSGGQLMDGLLDEISIHTTELDATNIAAMYNSGVPIDLSADSGNYTSSANLVSWWRFEDNLNDSGSNAWNCTATTEAYSTNVPT